MFCNFYYCNVFCFVLNCNYGDRCNDDFYLGDEYNDVGSCIFWWDIFVYL